MAWSGGTFSGLYDWVVDAAAGTRILASRHKAQDDVFIAGINQAVNKDGSNALTGNLNAGSQKLTSVSAATLATDAPIASQVQDGSMTYAVDSGGANAYVIALAPVESAHVGGQVIWFKASASNTGASTLNVNGIGVKDIKKNHGQALIADDIVANQLIGVVYDATTGDFEMVTMPAMIVANLTGNVTGNASGSALTVTQSAQTAITSVGTLTALQIDNININGNAITSTAGTDLTISPVSGQQIVLDGAIVVDAGVVTGATSITSTAFVGSGDSLTGIESYSPRGLICSMDTDADHDVAISVGGVKDATNTVNMTLAAILTKRIDSPWTVGDNNGGIKVASGGVLANTMYYIWLIKRSDTGVVDALFSLSATDPTLPTNYDYERLIGSVLTNSSSTIVSFTQSGDYFQYLEFDSGGPVNDIADASVTTSYETGTLSVPPLCIAHIYGYSYNPAMTGSSLHLWLKTKGQTLAFAGSDSWLVVDSSVAMDTTGREGVIKVDASREVEYTAYYDEDGGSPAAAVHISTFGFWMLTRSNP